MTALDVLLRIIIPILASFIGAVLAFRYQHTNELKREKRLVLQNLMIYRNVGAHELNWINSMNAVVLVFYNHKKVRELYHTFLIQTASPLYETGQYLETYTELVYQMAQCSGCKNLTKHEIRDCYAPIGLNLHYPNRILEPAPSISSANDNFPGILKNLD